MRRILVDHARRYARAKRGGAPQQVSLDEAALVTKDRARELLLLIEALDSLAELDPRRSQVVELRYFGGLSNSSSGVAGDSVVGVTVWRLRRPTASDSGERLLVQEGTEQEDWIPERISANTRLTPGDRVRVSVEAGRTGYLYVIDREQYADGSFSEPYLIFPTTRTLNGDNKVNAGKLIEIPAQDDGPPYFTLRRSRPDQVAEVLSMLITPEPLPNVEITDKAQKLAATEVAAWEKQWSIQVGSVELEGGAGKTWTKEEKEAGANPNVVLRAHAPAPQILYYRDGVRAAEPMLLNVQLRYRPAMKRSAR